MVESAEKQRERRMKRRREAEARGEELRGRGRPKAAVGQVVQDAGRRSSQLELDAKVAAGLKLEYGGALRAAESVAEARVMLRAHADKLAEIAYDYWLDARGVVHQRLVPAQRLLLRTAHVNNLSALARKVHNHSGRQMRCLSFKPVTGGNVKVGLLAELLRVVQSYVVRGILVELRYVMLNGLCGAACADGDGASVRPLCAALEGLARACAQAYARVCGMGQSDVPAALVRVHVATRAAGPIINTLRACPRPPTIPVLTIGSAAPGIACKKNTLSRWVPEQRSDGPKCSLESDLSILHCIV